MLNGYSRSKMNFIRMGLGVVATIALLSAACGGSDSATARPVALENVTSFDGFPILWLGSSYDSDGDGVGDMPLSVARPEQSDALVGPDGSVIRPATSSFGLGYGACDIATGRDSCTIPISISLYPVNATPDLAEEVQSGATRNVRGVDAVVFGEGELWIETGDVTMSISVQGGTPDERLTKATRVANSLEGANAKARAKGITKTSNFVPQDHNADGTANP